MADGTMQAPGKGATPNVATLANWAGAAVSLGLLVGVGVWGYQLLVRDVTGIPVIEASGGPMRVAPENPGGDLAQHQGLAVNSVAGTGEAAPPADIITLAPRHIRLDPSDGPVAAAPLIEKAEQASLDTSTEAPKLSAQPETVEATPELPTSVEALADFLAQGATPLDEVAPPAEDSDSPVVAALPEEPQAAPSNVPPGALARSLRPQVRPGGLQTAVLSAPAPETAGTVSEIAPETLAKGTRLAQLGAYDSTETARKEWDRIDAQFGEYLEGKSRVIERAVSGGRTFFRLRVHGFEDISDARRFCSALVAGRAECIPVTTR